MTVAFATQEAAKAGDQPRHLTQGWRDGRGFGAVGDDPGGRSFLGIEHHVTRPIRAVPTLGHEVEDAPGDDQVNHQSPLQPLQGAQLQGFDPAAGFPNLEEHFDIPLRMPLYD